MARVLYKASAGCEHTLKKMLRTCECRAHSERPNDPSTDRPTDQPTDRLTHRPTDPLTQRPTLSSRLDIKAWYLPNGSLNCLTQDWTRSGLSNSRSGIKIRHANSFMHSFHIYSDIPSFIHSFIHSVSNSLVLS